MSRTCYANFGHLIFHTAGPAIRTDDLSGVFAYINGALRAKHVLNVIVGGMENHIHILADFPVSVSVADIVREVKSSTTFHLKASRTSYRDFAWQQGYGYFSVSKSHVYQVRRYIETQREHHTTMSAEEEMRRIKKKHGISPDCPE